MTAVRPISVGDVLDGKYKVEGTLGEGAMGVVFSARHLTLNKRIAIKTLRAEIARDAELVGRFEQEARAASAIGHPNIIEVFDLGCDANGARYMVMEHLDGRSLAELIAANPQLSPERSVALMGQVLSALNAAHRRGIVHRDLKPENIFIATADDHPEVVKLLDFGISKVLEQADPGIAGVDSAARATQMGAVLGTPLYMSPEQARGQVDIDHRVDIWAVGCVLYEMLCGRTPFDGENYHQILVAILDGACPRPRDLRRQIPAALEQVILRAMSAEREQRFADAAQMREALAGALGHSKAAPPAAAATLAAPLATKPAAADLGQSQTGLAAASASGETDSAMLDALDRLNVTAQAGNSAVVTVDDDSEPAAPPARAAPAPTLEPAAVVEKPSASSAGDRFAPPASEGPTALVLDIAAPQVTKPRTTASRPVAAPRGRSQPRPAPVSSGSAVATVAKMVFVMLLLGAAGLAGYRYYTLGYILSPPAATVAGLDISVVPSSAEVVVDGEPAAAGRLSLSIEEPHTIEVRGEGRMLVRRTLTLQRGDAVALNLHLPYLLLPIDPVTVERGAVTKVVAPDADVDRALAKLGVYRRCLSAMGPELVASKKQYDESIKGKRISRRHLPSVRVLSVEIVSDCRLGLAGAREEAPEIAGVDRFVADYVETLEEVVELSARLAKYYSGNEFEIDKFKLGQRYHRLLPAAYAKLLAVHADFLVAATEVRAIYRERELAAIASTEGQGAHWQLRRLAAAAHSWVWSELALDRGKAGQAARAELAEVLAAVTEFAKAGPGVSAVAGADAYLEAVRALAELASADNKQVDVAAAVSAHNRSIDAFNAMSL